MASASTEDENVYLISDEEDPEEDLFMMTEFEAENYKKLRASKGAPEAPKVAALTDYDLNVVAEDETTATETHKNSKLTLGKSCWFKCSKCPYRTLDRLRLRQHSVDKHSKTRGRKPLFKCIDCDFKTETPALLRFHKDKSCPKRNKETLDFKITDLDLDGKDEEKSQPTPETLSEWFKCPHCPCRLQGEDLKKDHLQNFHAEKWRSCSSCSFETYETEKLEEHVRVEHNVSLNCEQCDFMTTSQQLLSHHLFHKHSVVKWSCTHCDHPAATKLDLDLHVDQKHSNWIQCSQCSVKVPTDDAMADHVLTHPVYVCKFCQFTTHDEQLIKDHLPQEDSLDASTEWVKCTMCLWTGRTKVCLDSHKSTIHRKRCKTDVLRVFQLYA